MRKFPPFFESMSEPLHHLVQKKEEEEEKRKACPASSLPVVNGRIYHLDIVPEQLADAVIIVGDPGRVETIAQSHLASVEVNRFHRGLRTVTGPTRASGLRVSLVTSGMGTPSLEIVFNELVALREMCLADRTPRTPRPKPLVVVRIGTSGALREDTALGTSVVASFGVGLDNTGVFVDVPASCAEAEIERRVTAALRGAAAPGSRFGDRISPYVAAADPAVVAALQRAAQARGVPHKVGLTASAAGFFANQGRQPFERVRLTVPGIDDVVGSVDLDGIEGVPAGTHVENLEMEAAALFHLGKAVGYRCGAICLTIAHRRAGTFLGDYAKLMDGAIDTALSALEELCGDSK